MCILLLAHSALPICVSCWPVTHLQTQIKLLLRTEHGTTLRRQHRHLFCFVFLMRRALKQIKKGQISPSQRGATAGYAHIFQSLMLSWNWGGFLATHCLRDASRRRSRRLARSRLRFLFMWRDQPSGEEPPSSCALALLFSRPLCSRIMKSLFILRELEHHRPSLPRLLSWRRFCHNKRAKQRMDCLFFLVVVVFVQTKCSLRLFYLLLILKELISLKPTGATLRLWFFFS